MDPALNFTQSQVPGANNSQPRPEPAKAVWNPVTQRWEGSGDHGNGAGAPMPDVQPRPAGSTYDMNQQGYVPTPEGMAPEGGVGRIDKPHEDAVAGGTNVNQSYGGYSGEMVRNPDGSLSYDSTRSGQAADVARMRGLGAAPQPTYQLDYGNANAAAALGNEVRGEQDNAISIARATAEGRGTIARGQGWKNLAQGEQMQRAAALSTRGGPLAQAAALRGQQGRAAAYTQKGAMAQGALRADEMESGRNAMAALTGERRTGDTLSQYNAANQAIQQGQMESQQRDLSQQRQLGYEQMGANVQKSGADATVSQEETRQGQDAAASARATRLADRDVQNASTLGQTGVQGIKNANDDNTSDRRAKRIRYLGGK